MSRPYINITTTSYCADPKKVVPVSVLMLNLETTLSPAIKFPQLRHIPTGGAFIFAGKRGKQTKPFAELHKSRLWSIVAINVKFGYSYM